MADILSLDFSGIPDAGGFPQGIGRGILRISAGVPSIEGELAPDTHYYVIGELGVFSYLKTINGSDIDYRGLVCSPGALEGQDADIVVNFVNPRRNMSGVTDLVFQLGVGCRGKTATEWVGGLLEAEMSGGVWSPKWRMSLVTVYGDIFTTLTSLEEDVPFRDENDLSVRIVGRDLGVMFNGVKSLQEETDFSKGNNVVLWVKAYTNLGPIPVLKGIEGTALESGKNYAISEMPGHTIPPPTEEAHYYSVPVRQLMDERKLISITDNSWRFVDDVEVTSPENGISFRASAGAVIVAPRATLRSADIQLCRFRYQ